MHHLKITITTAVLAAVTLVVSAAAAVLSTTPQQIAQAITVEEGKLLLLNDVADRLETHSSEGADRIRDVATLLGDQDGGVGCSPWDPRC
jgi:hypothetical protein